jgi:hypothetical protein
MQLHFRFRRVLVYRYLSFGRARLARKALHQRFPEIGRMSKTGILQRQLSSWSQKMAEHNLVVQRGIKMKLFPHSATRRLIFSNLDEFMVQMYYPEIAEVLNCISEFGRRVVPHVCQEPSAQDWWIDDDVLIHRRDWFAFCRCVVHITELVERLNPMRHTPCEALDEASNTAIRIFGPFVRLGLERHGAFDSEGPSRRLPNFPSRRFRGHRRAASRACIC